MKKYFLLLVIFFSLSNSYSQIQLYGEQIRGADKNAELISEPVLVTQEMKIVKIEGENNGFWIESLSGVLQSFYLDEPGVFFPNAIGYVLKPGKYSVYPNLSSGKDKATVKIYLE
jgi:hypothetical protein